MNHNEAKCKKCGEIGIVTRGLCTFKCYKAYYKSNKFKCKTTPSSPSSQFYGTR